jgi:2-dehydro-3-deoxyphosphogluconate aldolase/(4S)-4-hydroxy-2-oxoglutarate aldolase
MFGMLGRYKIIPILKFKDIETDDALRACEALIAGGLPVMEINFRRHSDSKAIRSIAKEFPDFIIGAGSILNRDQLLRATDCKARFATAPGVSVETIQTANKKKIAFAPGAATPSDIENILLNGCVDFQFFPAEASGGAEYLKAILEPFEHLPIDVFPKGGITFEKVGEYLSVPQITAVTLDCILKNEFIENKQWDNITEAAKRALGAAMSH